MSLKEKFIRGDVDCLDVIWKKSERLRGRKTKGPIPSLTFENLR